ncbi:hypothetical protein ACIGZJ_17285 [Kitasatospora sp. NPDC052868]|uniref:hypothetical protein n=1 Tax=Kitasatospora sp. NPDC052868 TaxID=3364060 RepID=UPI0037CBD66D
MAAFSAASCPAFSAASCAAFLAAFSATAAASRSATEAAVPPPPVPAPIRKLPASLPLASEGSLPQPLPTRPLSRSTGWSPAGQRAVACRDERHLGPVLRGARFDRIRDSAEAIDLELAKILAYCRSVEELDPVHTALVTLRGAGVQLLVSATPRSGWQVIQGTNPPPRPS